MTRSRLPALVVAIAVAATAGCAHKQQTRTSTAPAVVPTGPLTASAARATDTAPATDREGADASRVPGSVFFDFDSAQLVSAARGDLEKVAGKLKSQPGANLRIEGNCDERGTTEYNLALGASRADSARQYLERLGVPAGHIKTVSYGSERPKNPAHDEQAWSENRRDDLLVQ